MAILTEADLIQARANAARIEKGYGLKELRARRQTILDGQASVELAARASERAKEEAERALADCKSALKNREDEIMADVVAEQVDDGKGKMVAKYSNDNMRRAQLAERRKTDEEYLGLKAAEAKAKGEAGAAAAAHDQAKTAYNGLLRNYNLLQAEMYMAAAAIRSLGGYEAEAPAGPVQAGQAPDPATTGGQPAPVQ